MGWEWWMLQAWFARTGSGQVLIFAGRSCVQIHWVQVHWVTKQSFQEALGIWLFPTIQKLTDIWWRLIYSLSAYPRISRQNSLSWCQCCGWQPFCWLGSGESSAWEWILPGWISRYLPGSNRQSGYPNCLAEIPPGYKVCFWNVGQLLSSEELYSHSLTAVILSPTHIWRSHSDIFQQLCLLDDISTKIFQVT